MRAPVSDDDLLPIRALNDLIFCPRRCALHRTEGLWAETAHTVEGSHAHRVVHNESERLDSPIRVSRGMWLRSDRLRLVGIADLVEFHPHPDGGPDVPFPVEYKRGRRKRWDRDDVQLCAQALCLEEMLGVNVPAGAVFHVTSRRRREVAFDARLRGLTEEAATRLHALVDSGVTPPPDPGPKCKHCSLNAACLPELVADTDRYARVALALFTVFGGASPPSPQPYQ